MRTLLQDLRYAFRQLWKSPGFTITAVLILGFVIGTNTAIFSLIDAVILKQLPYPESGRLVQVFQPYRRFRCDPYSNRGLPFFSPQPGQTPVKQKGSS